MRLFLIALFLLSTCYAKAQMASVTSNDSIAYYLDLARFNISTNSYRTALDNTQKAIDFAKIRRDKSAEAKATLALGVLYLELKKFDDADQLLNRSITLYKTLPPSSELAYAYYNLGLANIEEEDFIRAESNFDRAGEIYKAINIPDAIELLDLQRGIIYFAHGKIKQATGIFQTLASSKSDTSDEIRSEALYYMGRIEAANYRNNMALNFMNRALARVNPKTQIELRSDIYRSLSEIYEKLGGVEQSYSYLKQHLTLRDSIRSATMQKLGADDYADFKESERLKTIEQLNQSNRQQQRAGKFAKLISILGIALISILSLLCLSLYKNNIIRTQSNLLLKEKNRELQVAKDKAEKASKARSEFLSTVSHELRTPLNAINGITHLLLQEEPKESQLNYLQSLKFSGDYLLTFINEILEINRIESNAVQVEHINFNLKALLTNIQNSLKEQANKNNNRYTIEIDEKIPNLLVGDPTKLSQIFLNLINNALKFTKNGDVKVIARHKVTEDKNTTIHFEVVDTGIGIPEDKLDAVFDSFSQGSIEINRKYGGTGLGLNIVKKLIGLLGGQIKLESKIGKGSTFSFDLTFQISMAEQTDIHSDYDETVFINKKVLLIEDNKINQMITKKMLENKQMLCDIIDNGEDAIEAVKNNYYDLVLMDVHLPGINGTTATQIIRTFDTTTRIIALTAISLNENRESLLSFGMNDVLTKPFDPEDFYRIIAENI
ncbi:MAG: response regulator [Flavobacterium sp.]|nr:response regulator [Flavobacterium sp.]